MIECKVCSSDCKEYIEELILQGNSNFHIARLLQGKGMNISHASINRHKTRHMTEQSEQIKAISFPKNNTKYDRNIGISINPIDRIDQILKMKNCVRKFQLINTEIVKILIKQISIVSSLQDNFIKGESRYPYEEIRGLFIINDILIKLGNFINTMPNTLPLSMSKDSPLSDKVTDINNAMINGKISVDTANKLLIGLTTSSKLVEYDELEKRISELENR